MSVVRRRPPWAVKYDALRLLESDSEAEASNPRYDLRDTCSRQHCRIPVRRPPSQHERVVGIANDTHSSQQCAPQNPVVSDVPQEWTKYRPLWNTAHDLLAHHAVLARKHDPPVGEVGTHHSTQIGRHPVVAERLPNAAPGQRVERVGDVEGHRHDDVALGHCVSHLGSDAQNGIHRGAATAEAELHAREVGSPLPEVRHQTPDHHTLEELRQLVQEDDGAVRRRRLRRPAFLPEED
ncbi:unnamed protein product [Euphydryas editha]|uniref:Uncharacterized protein n=1 Tax=Euphydryas editha TaxID=104508 RepID=A0AAU9U451_EUPED|nr:unnamed protein product [Euphydryas editha]